MAEENKKKGLLGKLFGRKSKEEKIAEEAAELAAKQQLVDEQMAARMAAINAAALKSAREQDEAAGLVEKQAEEDAEAAAAERARIEEEERIQAEEQAKHDVEAAKRLTEEKKQKEKEHQEKLAREAEEKRIAEEKAKLEREAEAKAEKERLAKLEAEKKAKAEAEQKAREAAEKAEAEALAKEQARQKAAEEEAARKAAEEEARRKAEEEALAKAEAEKSASEARMLKEQQEAERKAREAEEQRLAEEAKAAQEAEEEAEAARLAELKAEQERLEAEKIAAARAAQVSEDKIKALEPELKKGFLERISDGLKKSTSRMSESITATFTKRKLDDEALEDLEDLLIQADFGIGPATKVTTLLAKDKFDKEVTDMEIKVALADVVSDILTPLEKPLKLVGAKPEILLFVGVNGSGKTTTLGKIAKRFADDGKKVLIVAGDTFRAAADAQLKVWGDRAGAPVMSGKQGADAAGLVYDAIERAKTENYDILMIDTAGRLQNRTELMDELSKIVRVIKKQDETAPHHSLLVLDATVGQNALLQTEAFKNIAGITGLIMTKLDGTAKGGVLVALSDKFEIPIHAIGIGERIEDLENFSAPVFAAALSGVADAMKAVE
ncbi:MAG: signal recognition particle-docking protein FtsY [Hellea sp.]|nr:signal recognition particle-docking protein FtsY [Hellea sp.]